jgi:hypothetical protein
MFTLTWQDEERGGNGKSDGSYRVDRKDGQFLVQDYVQRMGLVCDWHMIMSIGW